MWTLYDKLIEGIPREHLVDEVIQGSHWNMVRSGGAVGLAMALPVETRPRMLPDFYAGMPLRELAEAAKSWNFTEAGLGMAAVNAFYNSPERPWAARSLARGENVDAFSAWRSLATGKKVAVIGHFRHLEQSLGDICELSILEKRPSPGDYPDSACEFLLPLQDYVFATGVTCINKTLPRLLELSRKTGLILVGPSVPMAPLLFSQGVRDLQGFVVTDLALCRAVAAGENTDVVIGATGKRVSVTPDMV
jgi:uncharacterized protein (DUF4213/DUF364 family)